MTVLPPRPEPLGSRTASAHAAATAASIALPPARSISTAAAVAEGKAVAAMPARTALDFDLCNCIALVVKPEASASGAGDGGITRFIALAQLCRSFYPEEGSGKSQPASNCNQQ